MAKLNSPMHKKVMQLMEAQGRSADFKTRKAVFNLHNLHKRLGDYVGTEAQNFALHNVVSHEMPDRDVMLMKSKHSTKHTFDIPGHSLYDGTGSDPNQAQTSAIKDAYGRTTINGSVGFAPPSNTYNPGPSNYVSPFGAGSSSSGGIFTPAPGATPGNYVPPSNQQTPVASQPLNRIQNLLQGRTQTNTPPAINQAVQQATGTTQTSVASPQRTTSQILSMFPKTPLRQQLNVSGAVRIYGTDQVYTLGPGGKPITDPQQLLSQGFREDEVQQVSREEAQALGIDVSRIPQTPPTSPTNAPGQTPEGFLAGGAQTPEGILATEEARQAKEAEKVRAAQETKDFQERSAAAGLAFSGIRTAGERDIAAASYAKQEGISLSLAQVILKAAVAEQKRLVGEIREVGNKLVRVSPDGKVTTLYEDTSQLTDQQKMDIQQQYLGRELELRRQSELEMEKILAAAQLGRYEPNAGSTSSDLTRTQQATQSGDQIMIQARQQLTANVGQDGFYDPGIYMNFRNQLSSTNPQGLAAFDKELAGKLNPIDRARLGIPTPTTTDNPFG